MDLTLAVHLRDAYIPANIQSMARSMVLIFDRKHFIGFVTPILFVFVASAAAVPAADVKKFDRLDFCFWRGVEWPADPSSQCSYDCQRENGITRCKVQVCRQTSMLTGTLAVQRGMLTTHGATNKMSSALLSFR
ncbi:MAG: hypothetical protein CTY31_12395 [Hyphomicrobium sp.]|nr:MAG: hypothetical protein CTY39_09980 [Hyphomicrobium sp.]PPC98811.1 MAG: hypothetical protein CTY31_12395 [Hyphomicrobium sp.]